MPVPAVAEPAAMPQSEHCADLPIAQRAQQALKAGAACSGSRNPEIIIDYINLLPAERACTIDQAILAPLAFSIVLALDQAWTDGCTHRLSGRDDQR